MFPTTGGKQERKGKERKGVHNRGEKERKGKAVHNRGEKEREAYTIIGGGGNGQSLIDTD